jgi:hypothetical protein
MLFGLRLYSKTTTSGVLSSIGVIARRKPIKSIIAPNNSLIYKAPGIPILLNVPPKAGKIAPTAMRTIVLVFLV